MAITLGSQFKSFSDLSKTIEEYKKSNLNEYYIRDCRTLIAQKKRSLATVQHLNSSKIEDLKYYQIRFSCIHGGRPYKNKDNKTSNRKTQTFKKGCKAGFILKLSNDVLEIKELNEDHCHETSLATFRALHHQRLKLPENIKNDVKNCLSKGANKKLIQSDIIQKTGCNITLKDLTNLNRKKEQEKTFEDCMKMLQNVYNCKVEVLQDNNNSLKAFYFQDKKMTDCYHAFPEMLFMDGTYCLMDNRASCYILLVEDSNGNSEVVAVCFILEENVENINWFIETFKLCNKQWEKTEVIMTDKDAKERDVLKENFPTAHLIICFFHVMQIFKREISKKIGMNADDIALTRIFLQKLAYSKSPQQYDEIYAEFIAKVPECVVYYYNKNWHPIKEQWVMGYTYKTQCFLNKANNRIECVNSKLKAVIKRYSSMEECLQNLFVVINSMRLETDSKAARIAHKIRTSSSINIVYTQFEKLLTPYAYSYVEDSLKKTYKDESFINVGEKTFLYKKSDLLLQVTPLSCECLFWCSMGLPCGHIFQCRRILNLDLFNESICLERWKNSYYRLHQRVYEIQNEDLNENSSPIQISVNCPKVEKRFTSQQKFKMMQSECLKLSQLGGEVGGQIFMHRYQAIKSIVAAWSQGEEIIVSTKKNFEELTQELDVTFNEGTTTNESNEEHNDSPPTHLNNLEIEVITEDHQGDGGTSSPKSIQPDNETVKMSSDIEVHSETLHLSQIVIPSKINKRGRPEGLGMTVVGLPHKRPKIT